MFAGERPLVVRTSRPHQKNWVVGFDGVDSREAADELRGTTLFAEALAADADDEDALWVHELIGARVVDADGVDRGCIEAVQENPASDVLVLDSGALVPLTFAVGWDVRGERLRIDEVHLLRRGTLPKTSSGKVRRRETRARLQAGTLAMATGREE